MSLHSAIKLLLIVALLSGLGLALLGLSAPMGVWFGVWDFRQGFTLLRNAHTYAPWIAGGVIIASVVALVFNFISLQGRLTRLAVFALVAGGLASLAYIIPETFRAPEGENYPPIHDISTDTVNPPQFVDVVALRANAPNTLEYGKSEGMTPETLAELQTTAYPDIKPVVLNDLKAGVFANALNAVEQLGWELVSANETEGRIEATDTTFWFRFKDDVVVYIKEENGKTIVNARSVSRVGRGDVGANAIRLRKFFELLNQ